MEFIIEFIKRDTVISEFEILLLERMILIIFTIPLVTTITGIFRHIIGLRSLSVFAPIVLTYAFYQLGGFVNITADPYVSFSFERGLKFGLTIFFAVLVSTIVVYSVVKSLRMHYVPKSTLILIANCIALIACILLGTYLFNSSSLVYIDLFSLVMIITLSDTVISTLTRKDIYTTILVSCQTLIIALISYSIISLDTTREYVLAYGPVLILLLILVNFFVGRFVGLRLTEYWRFRQLLLDETINVRKPNTKKEQKSTGSK